MYVQIDAALQNAIRSGLETKLREACTAWLDKFTKKHPGIGWRVLNANISPEYHQVWALYNRVFRRTSNNYYNPTEYGQILFTHSIAGVPHVLVPLIPPIILPFGHDLSSVLKNRASHLSIVEVMALAPETMPDFEILTAMGADHTLLRNAMNSALARSSLAVALKEAPFLHEFVPAEYLTKLAAKAERKPKEKPEPKPEPSQEEQDALLIAATRLRIQ